MPTEESKNESFDESVKVIAEKVRAGRKAEVSAEQEKSTEEQVAADLEAIRGELLESYGDTGGGASTGDDDGDDDDNGEDDAATALQPANLGDQEDGGYLNRVPDEHKRVVAGWVQEAVQVNIAHASSKAQKKNDPYLYDVFHDSLAQFLHKRMQDQGLL